MRSDRGSKSGAVVPSDYFRHVPLHALLFLPVTWVLLPVSAFAPESLAPYLFESVMRFILYLQTWLAYTFKLILGIHLLEILYTLIRCNNLGLSSFTTFKWVVNVAFNGIFATRMIHEPEKYKNQ